jgi:hypothetical protein
VQPPRAISGTLQVDELLDDWGEGVVFLENGHVAYFTFAVIDVAKILRRATTVTAVRSSSYGSTAGPWIEI